MEQEHANSLIKPVRVPWNKGKLVGAKPPLRPSHVWSIRTKLHIEGISATLLSSIWPSTASSAAATWLDFLRLPPRVPKKFQNSTDSIAAVDHDLLAVDILGS